MRETLGSWPNAPLIYLVVEVVFPRMNELADPLSKLHDALILQYPVTSGGEIQSVDFVGNNKVEQTVERFKIYQDPVRTAGVSVSNSSIVLHVTRYQNEADLLRRLQAVLECVDRTLPRRPVLRIGMRLVDVVVPSTLPAHVPSYVKEQFDTPPTPQGMSLQQHLAFVRYAAEGRKACAIKHHGPALRKRLLPDDLAALDLATFGPTQDAQQAIAAAQPIAFIDTDAQDTEIFDWDVAQVIERTQALKAVCKRAFESCVTDHALAHWKGERR